MIGIQRLYGLEMILGGGNIPRARLSQRQHGMAMQAVEQLVKLV